MIATIERNFEEVRRELVSHFGWTHFDVKCELDAEKSCLLVSGTVLVPRIARLLRDRALAALPSSWHVDVAGVRELRSGHHRSLLARVTPLTQRPGGALATELSLEDGPVELLTSTNGAHLVRALDGTLGWMASELGARVVAPSIEPPRPDWQALAPALLAFLGAPYRLGGTRKEGVDCSGLLQRVYRSSQRILLPRHSTDQLDMTSRFTTAGTERETGDLVFTWTEREGPCHVGALVVGEDPVVFHASLSRRAVVRDPLARFVEGARRIEWVPRSAIEELGRRNAGKTSLILGLST